MMPPQNYTIRKHISILFRSVHERPVFSRLDLELTERCNNNCVHCYINLPEDDELARERELTTDEWKRIIREAADLGFLTIRFTGGEPLLRTDFADLYTHTRRLGMKVKISTNGRLITPELADLFARIPPLEKIDITAYGMHEKTYETVTRSRGSFREFRNGIRLLSDRGIPFVIRGVVLPMNKEDVPELNSWAREVTGVEKDPSYTVTLDLRTRRDSMAKNQIISRLRASPEDAVTRISLDEEAYRNEMGEFCSRFMGPGGDRIFTCGAGHGGIVDAYGMLQPCMFVRDPRLVIDLRAIPLKEAIPAVLSRIQDLRSSNPEYLERCGRCFLHGLCDQCPGKSWSEHGTLDTPVEYYCRVAHEKGRWLGLLQEGERAWEVQDWKSRVARLSHRE